MELELFMDQPTTRTVNGKTYRLRNLDRPGEKRKDEALAEADVDVLDRRDDIVQTARSIAQDYVYLENGEYDIKGRPGVVVLREPHGYERSFLRDENTITAYQTIHGLLTSEQSDDADIARMDDPVWLAALDTASTVFGNDDRLRQLERRSRLSPVDKVRDIMRDLDVLDYYDVQMRKYGVAERIPEYDLDIIKKTEAISMYRDDSNLAVQEYVVGRHLRIQCDNYYDSLEEFMASSEYENIVEEIRQQIKGYIETIRQFEERNGKISTTATIAIGAKAIEGCAV